MLDFLKGRQPSYGESPEAQRIVPEGITHEETVAFLEQARQAARIEDADDDRRIEIAQRLVDAGMDIDAALERVTE